MNSASVDLIYLDPPFNSNHNYAAPIGSKAAGAEFKDTWTLSDIDIAWLDLIEAKHFMLNRVIHSAMSNGNKSYLIYMAIRLLEMHRLLKETGSIYLHCDPTMSHHLKLLLDAIFGIANFRNEVIWCYKSGGASKRQFSRKHDIVFFYSKNPDQCNFNVIKVKSYGQSGGGQYGAVKYHKDKDGIYSIVSARDWWEISMLSTTHSERVGYPTQKPLKLLERIIQASSNEGDLVLDPFCGCATACIAAESLRRQWAGIDISSKAAELVQVRMRNELGLFDQSIHRTDIPQRTDLGKLPFYGSKENRKYLYGEQGGLCNGCDEHFKIQNLEVDHIIAKAKSGSDHLNNLQLLCGYCNRVKGDRGQEYLLARLAA